MPGYLLKNCYSPVKPSGQSGGFFRAGIRPGMLQPSKQLLPGQKIIKGCYFSYGEKSIFLEYAW